MNILFLGVLPPPIHGASTVNKKIINYFSENLVNIYEHNTYANNKFLRVLKVLEIIKQVIKIKNINYVYISLSGGMGLIYDIFFLILLRKNSSILHHHSWAYISKKSLLMKLLVKITQSQAKHIFLCQKMKDDFVSKYGYVDGYIISNISIIPAQSQIIKKSLKSIGYISNLTKEKGVLDFIKLAKLLKNTSISFILAGPCKDQKLIKLIKETEKNSNLRWLGSLYKESKSNFWKEIDLCVFPTKYKNEAEPLIVWEAFSFGVPVISNNKGCIGNQLTITPNLIIKNESNFVEEVISIINDFTKKSSLFQKQSLMVSNYFMENKKPLDVLKLLNL